jgi:hypothetical protein
LSTPSEHLAARIVDRLVAERLVRPDHAPRLLPMVAEGKLRPEHWRLVIERAVMATP